MAARVTPEELVLMHQLYNKYHSYARVAREIGRSASCVRYNVMMKNAPNVNIHETGIQVDPKDQSVLACEITENGNVFHRMGKNDCAFHIDKEIVVTDPKERIRLFVFTNEGKHIWVVRLNHTIDILDAETYQVLKRFYRQDWGWFAENPIILYTLSNETGDLVAFISMKDLKVFKTIWGVNSEQAVFHKEYDLLHLWFSKELLIVFVFKGCKS